MPDVFRTAQGRATVSVDLAGEVSVSMSDGKVRHLMAQVSPYAWPALLDYAEHLRDERVGVWRSPVKEWRNFVVYSNVSPKTHPGRIMVLDETSGHVVYFDGPPASSDVHRIPARVARLYYIHERQPSHDPAIQGLTQEALDAMEAAQS